MVLKKGPATPYCYEITFAGRTMAKKNRQGVGITKAGKQFRYYRADAAKSKSDMELQVPGYLRDLKLRDPNIDVFFVVPDGRSDRDNSLTVILDALTAQGVLANDSIAQCNGRITLHPAKISDHYLTQVILSSG